MDEEYKIAWYQDSLINRQEIGVIDKKTFLKLAESYSFLEYHFLLFDTFDILLFNFIYLYDTLYHLRDKEISRYKDLVRPINRSSIFNQNVGITDEFIEITRSVLNYLSSYSTFIVSQKEIKPHINKVYFNINSNISLIHNLRNLTQHKEIPHLTVHINIDESIEIQLQKAILIDWLNHKREEISNRNGKNKKTNLNKIEKSISLIGQFPEIIDIMGQIKTHIHHMKDIYLFINQDRINLTKIRERLDVIYDAVKHQSIKENIVIYQIHTQQSSPSHPYYIRSSKLIKPRFLVGDIYNKKTS